MSKVQTLQPDYFRSKNSNRYSPQISIGKKRTTPSFGKAIPEITTAEGKALYDACEKGLKTPMLTVSDFLAKNDGELQSQIITAVFTTTLAPLMIAFNPFSKKDKKDKEYLALRQPVSAVIALACVMPATNILNNALGKMGSTGKFSGLDIRMAPSKFYLKPEFENAYKEAKHNGTLEAFEKDLKVDDDVKALRGSNNPIKKILYKGSLKVAYTEKVHGATSEFFAALLHSDPKAVNFKDGKIEINQKFNGKDIKAKEIPGISSQEDVNKYLEKHSLSKRKFGDFMKENFGFEFYKDGSIKPESTINKLREINAKAFLETLGIDDNVDGEELKRFLSVSRQNKTAEEIKGHVKGDPKEFVGSMVRQNVRDMQLQYGEIGIKQANSSLNQLIGRLNILNLNEKLDESEAKQIKLKKLQELMDKPLGDVMKTMKDSLVKNNFKKELAKENGIENVAKRFMKKLASNSSKNFDNFMKYSAMGSNLFITAISCTILNWAYPRFVEMFFPKLVNKAKPIEEKKGGNQ